MNNIKKYAGYILSGMILSLGIAGARLQSNLLLFTMLGMIIIALLLAVFDKIDEKQYPALLFGIGLGLIYQVSLMTNHLVGTDIHYEYYFARLTYLNGSWDSTIGHSYNSAVSISVFIPMMARLLHMPLEWAFKIIPPLFLAGVPVVMFYIFKKEFDAKTAFLSVFFFISIPTMFLELSGLAKQAIGELFLISCLGLIVYNVFKREWVRYILIGVLAILTALSHYSMGGTLFCYLLGAVILFPIGKYIFKRTPNINLKYLTLVLVIFTAVSALFYGWAAQGAPLRDVLASAGITSGLIANPSDAGDVAGLPGMSDSADPGSAQSDAGDVAGLPGMSDSADPGSAQYKHWEYPEPAVAVALGADFSGSSTIAKIFRLFQYATQILIIVGCITLLVQYKRRSLGYMVFLVLSGVILTMVVFLPGFSPLFNASRFYNLILLFMSPAAIIGGKLILRNYKMVAVVILIPYFLFTSGAIFELVKINDLTVITLPYSHSLSAARLDSTALSTDNDIAARDWVENNLKFPIYGDMWGSTTMFEVRSNLSAEVNTMLGNPFVYVFVFREDALKPDPIPGNCYILLRERNTERQEITYQVGVGLRKTLGYDEVGFREVLNDRPVLFQSGNAVVYGMKEQ